MTFSVIIPARFAATRLPGKLLLDLAGRPVLRHVVERALASEARQVVVAADDARIAALAESAGARAVMTAADHASGTDRVREAVAALGLDGGEIVVNVQGDEPLIPVSAIHQVARNLSRHGAADIATLCDKIAGAAEFADPNAVKVVRDDEEFALYFSRAPIPHGGADRALRHIGLYAYRAEFLERFASWPRSALERSEGLEQLRALSHGAKVHAALASERFPPGIDTENDLREARRHLLGEGAAP